MGIAVRQSQDLIGVIIVLEGIIVIVRGGEKYFLESK
jgi:hypothetical protein